MKLTLYQKTSQTDAKAPREASKLQHELSSFIPFWKPTDHPKHFRGVISDLEIYDGEGEKGRVSADSCCSCAPSQGDGDGDSFRGVILTLRSVTERVRRGESLLTAAAAEPPARVMETGTASEG
jgi:hypothetical protein